MGKMQSLVIWIQTASLSIKKHSKNKLFIYKDISEDVKKRFDNSNFEVDRPLALGESIKVIGLRSGELGGQIMEKSFWLRGKAYSCLKDSNDEGKEAKGRKKGVS